MIRSPTRPLRIHVDIGHPAHVHFFRHPVTAWRRAGHSVRITSRDKDVALALLDAHGLQHQVLTRVGRGTAGLLSELVRRVWLLRRELHRHGGTRGDTTRADVVTAIGGGFIAPAGALAGVPSVVWTDTEHVASDRWLSEPWATALCTPDCFLRDLGTRHVRYRGVHELAYLHPSRFTPDPEVPRSLGMAHGQPYALVRFVSWGAGHDVGHGGFTDSQKRRLVKGLGEHMPVLLTSEAEIPPDLRTYAVRLPPERLHDLLAFSSLCVGEGATLASEAAVLGVPAVYVSSLALSLGYLRELARFGMVALHLRGEEGVEAALALAADPEAPAAQRRRRELFLADRVDVARFVVRTVESVAAGVTVEGLRGLDGAVAPPARRCAGERSGAGVGDRGDRVS